ncbi:MAG TPA: HNH endonuclease signature motif containing protein [Ilumatobacteraceae bacterium]|nr:HNH endonuclease signature motif containing protein [Ilumatobacteraceae bacterium]
MDGLADRSLDSAPSTAEFVAAWAAHEREGARLALAVRHLEMSGEWATDGSVSIAAWLRQHCRMSNRDANALVHRGRFLDSFESIAEAACDGVLSAGQAAALKSACPAHVEPVMRLQQAELVSIVAPLSVADTERAAGLWRQRAEALVELPEPTEPMRELRVAHTSDGLVGKFVLDTDGALQFEQAIRIASTWDGSADSRSGQRRSADALVDVCAFFNANHDRGGTPRQRPHVELFVEADSLATSPLAWTTEHAYIGSYLTDAYLCDCVIHRVQRAGNAVLDYGRGTRTVPIDLFRAVAARDGGCRFPGCDRKVRWCDAHHIRYWRNMGPTELENLTLLCNRHHHLVHQPGWHLKLLPDADLEVTCPDGSVRTSRPRGQPAKGP